MASNPFQRVIDWYTLSERRKNTFATLYENSRLTHDQVLRLKQARAAFEVIPYCVWTPYLLFMMPRCMYANTAQRVIKVLLLGALGIPICEAVSRFFRDRYYWPVVAGVYKELIEAEK
jgi:hypothetical protein